jgi:hypothetical protein
MKPHLLHLKPHTRHLVIACFIALVLLTIPAEVFSRSWSSVGI